MSKLNIQRVLEMEREKGAINVVEIETLIFVKYSGDKHIKNTTSSCLICKINHIKRKESLKWQTKHYVHVRHIYWSHKFCIKWKIRLAEAINFKQLLCVLEIITSYFISYHIQHLRFTYFGATLCDSIFWMEIRNENQNKKKAID